MVKMTFKYNMKETVDVTTPKCPQQQYLPAYMTGFPLKVYKSPWQK